MHWSRNQGWAPRTHCRNQIKPLLSLRASSPQHGRSAPRTHCECPQNPLWMPQSPLQIPNEAAPVPCAELRARRGAPIACQLISKQWWSLNQNVHDHCREQDAARELLAWWLFDILGPRISISRFSTMQRWVDVVANVLLKGKVEIKLGLPRWDSHWARQVLPIALSTRFSSNNLRQ